MTCGEIAAAISLAQSNQTTLEAELTALEALETAAHATFMAATTAWNEASNNVASKETELQTVVTDIAALQNQFVMQGC